MKIPNKQELQQITFNHSEDIKFKDFMNLQWWINDEMINDEIDE